MEETYLYGICGCEADGRLTVNFLFHNDEMKNRTDRQTRPHIRDRDRGP